MINKLNPFKFTKSCLFKLLVIIFIKSLCLITKRLENLSLITVYSLLQFVKNDNSPKWSPLFKIRKTVSLFFFFLITPNSSNTKTDLYLSITILTFPVPTKYKSGSSSIFSCYNFNLFPYFQTTY